MLNSLPSNVKILHEGDNMSLSKINELKIKINELNQKIKDTTELRNKLEDKKESIRKFVVTNICISGVGYLILGPLIHPAIGLASLFLLCGSVVPGGIAILHYEGKTDKLQREIDIFKRDVYNCESELVTLNRDNLKGIPVIEEPTPKTTIETTQITKKENTNKKTR